MKTNGQLMQERLNAALESGEVPYQANRAAVKEFDIFEDVEAGTAQVEKMVAGIRVFVAKLEGFKDVAEAVARRADSFVR